VDSVSSLVEILEAGRSLRVSPNTRPVNKLRKVMLRSVLSRSGSVILTEN
jgi:hypothetical protein